MNPEEVEIVTLLNEIERIRIENMDMADRIDKLIYELPTVMKSDTQNNITEKYSKSRSAFQNLDTLLNIYKDVLLAKI